jgi:nucleotide-binding universal stress UspA family protein
VLVADDGSEEAARARGFAVMLAAGAGARLTAVYVRAPTESKEEAYRKLGAALAAATAAGLRCGVVIERPVGMTNTGRRIVATARRSDADLIVMGTRGAGFTRRLLGSVSAYVVSRGRVSVCLIR